MSADTVVCKESGQNDSGENFTGLSNVYGAKSVSRKQLVQEESL